MYQFIKIHICIAHIKMVHVVDPTWYNKLTLQPHMYVLQYRELAKPLNLLIA